MATVNFSVPDEISARLSRAFKGRNKSAILSRLMEQAVEQEELRKRRIKAIDQLLALRASATTGAAGKRTASDAEISKARKRGRP